MVQKLELNNTLSFQCSRGVTVERFNESNLAIANKYSKMKKFGKYFDLFPLNFQFNIKDNKMMKTVSGGIFSILLIISTLSLVIFNVIYLIRNYNPIVSITQEFIGNQKSQDFPLDIINLINLKFDPQDYYSPIYLNPKVAWAIFYSKENSNSASVLPI